jgi:hypothetical protein
MHKAKFIQLAPVGDKLHALADDGSVWRHYPAQARCWRRLPLPASLDSGRADRALQARCWALAQQGLYDVFRSRHDLVRVA